MGEDWQLLGDTAQGKKEKAPKTQKRGQRRKAICPFSAEERKGGNEKDCREGNGQDDRTSASSLLWGLQAGGGQRLTRVDGAVRGLVDREDQDLVVVTLP